MRINCPECGGGLSFSRAKPGKYQPTCPNCKRSFRLTISNDPSKRVAVGKLVPAGSEATVDPGGDATRDARPKTSPVAELPKESSTKESLADTGGEIPDRLGGYKILRLIGRGAMGSVFQAKQLSLDRLVALKTVRGRLAEKPSSLARFAREAYAAAQLAHHNIVQIYDFGEEDGRYYFSMEWVRGGPLDQLIRKKGALDPKLAAGYTLQAARGLQYAHRNGMVHRDIKPANLLLSEDGVIKVADLGLVKIPDAADAEFDVPASAASGMASGTQVTLQGTAVGTPAYMAPEQGVDAATVDHRADIYSLGCSLYCMLTGHPPYEGSKVSEVMRRHAEEPAPTLKLAGVRVPAALQQIVGKATAKRPSDRYAAISEMIQDLESFLGIRADGAFSPNKSQADSWHSLAVDYAKASQRMRLRRPILVGWTISCIVATLLAPLLLNLSWWTLGPSMWLGSLMAGGILAANSGNSPTVTKLRAWIESLSWSDWGIGLAGLLIGLGIIAALGWWPGLIIGGLLGVIAAGVEHFAILTPTRQDRRAPLEAAAKFVRDLRIDGADERGIRDFVARYSGRTWEAIFEDLFGYDALSKTRQRLVNDPSFPEHVARPSLRDKICRWLSQKTQDKLDARDQRRLARIEQRGLTSEGVSESEARERAWQIAAAIMDNAREIAAVETSLPQAKAEAAAARAKRARIKAMLADARSGRYRKKRDRAAPLKSACSGPTRFLLGCLLLAWFAIGGKQAGIFEAFQSIDPLRLDPDQLESAIRETAATATKQEQGGAGEAKGHIELWSIGSAGLLLAMSTFVSGWRMTPPALLATIVILFGPALGISSIGALPAWIVSLLIGITIYIPGVIWGEEGQ